MIDNKIFIAIMAKLQERYGRELSAPLMRDYKVILDAELTSAELERAYFRILRYNSFFPSPQELIEAARGGASERAELEWLQVARAIMEPSKPVEFSPDAKAAIEALGGIVYLRETFHPSQKREFISSFLALQKHREREETDSHWKNYPAQLQEPAK